MNQQELQELCGVWQKRLRLQDWDVKVVVVRVRDMGPEKSACVSVLSTKRNAVIQIMDERDVTDEPHFTAVYRGQELDLVHELLHIYTDPFQVQRPSSQEVSEEQMIHALSTALIEAYGPWLGSNSPPGLTKGVSIHIMQEANGTR